MTDWHGYFRRGTGPGWVLVGDAGHFKDFTPAQGISDALRQAHRLADAIVRGFDGDLDAELKAWTRWRDRDAYDMYWFATAMGRPGVTTPLVTHILAGLARDPNATTQFLRLLNHELPSADVFTPRRVLTAAGRAVLERPGRFVSVTRELSGEVANQIRHQRFRRRLPNCR